MESVGKPRARVVQRMLRQHEPVAHKLSKHYTWLRCTSNTLWFVTAYCEVAAASIALWMLKHVVVVLVSASVLPEHLSGMLSRLCTIVMLLGGRLGGSGDLPLPAPRSPAQHSLNGYKCGLWSLVLLRRS